MKKYSVKFIQGDDKASNFGLAWRGTIEIHDGTVELTGHRLPAWLEYTLFGCGIGCSEICCCGCLVASGLVELVLSLIVNKSKFALPLSLISGVGGKGKQVIFTAVHPQTQMKHLVCIELSNPDTAREVASLLSQDVPADN